MQTKVTFINTFGAQFMYTNQGLYSHSNAFFQDFPRLAKIKFQGFPGKNPFFQNFPENVPFKTLLARGQKVHIQNRL